MHLTAKEGPPGLEREQFEVREVEDLVNLNDCTLKEAPNVPILNDHVERISGRKFFFKFDGAHAFSQVVLDEASRDVCTVRTPIGMIRPTRLVEALCNAGTVLQDRMGTVFTALPQHVRDDTLIYFDDINGGVDDKETLISDLEQIFTCVVDSSQAQQRQNRISHYYFRRLFAWPRLSVVGRKASAAHL